MKYSLLTSVSFLFLASVTHAELTMQEGQVKTVMQEQNVENTLTSPQPIASISSESSFGSDLKFQTCLANLKSSAMSSGVQADFYDRYTQNLTPDYSILEKLNYQPEFSTPIWDYLSGLVDQERVELGQQNLLKYQDVLRQVSQTYGVPAETVVAVWGVESNFGNIVGKYPLLQALGTLSCEGRRQGYFQSEFFSTLRILQRGDLTLDQLKGSWAGAFGQTQFMPSTYERLAVDFDGDGRRDLVSSAPDALASTANFLKKSGWQTGMPWGFEVKLPQGMSMSGQGRKNKKPLSLWINQGVVRISGEPLLQGNLTESTPAGLMAPAGENGPIFLVFKNFDAIYSYNAAESYALAIAHLSDRLQGQSTFVTPWPTDDAGTSRAERREIQQYLLDQGYDIGAPDGLIGDKTKQAIRQEQQKMGLTPTARAGQVFLNAIRNATASKMMM